MIGKIFWEENQFIIKCNICENEETVYVNFIEHIRDNHFQVLKNYSKQSTKTEILDQENNLDILDVKPDSLTSDNLLENYEIEEVYLQSASGTENELQEKANEEKFDLETYDTETSLVLLQEDLKFVNKENNLDENLPEAINDCHKSEENIQEFKCNVCGRCFKHLNSFNHHTENKVCENKFKCDVCGEFFKLKKRYDNHVQNKTCRKICKLCGKKFSQSSNYYNHVNYKLCQKSLALRTENEVQEKANEEKFDFQTHDTETSLALLQEKDLELENKENSLDEYLSEAINKESEGNIQQLECNLCGRRFKHFNNFHHHTENKMCENKFKCNICGEFFKLKKRYDNHVQNERCRKICKLCGKKFNHYSGLSMHKKQCEKLIEENLDLETYGTETSLTVKIQPIKKKSIKREGIYFCDYCEFSSRFEGRLIKHVQRHESKEDSCPYCSKRFKNNFVLKKHIRIHTNERPYKCEICLRTFNESGNLNYHIRNRHTEIRNIKCTFENCEKMFKSHKNRKAHEIRFHLNKYQTLCNVCGQTFSSTSMLHKHHKRKHLEDEEKPFTCRFCNEKFAFKDEFTEHENVHLGIKAYECKLCSKEYYKRKSYVAHIRIHHKNKPNKL